MTKITNQQSIDKWSDYDEEEIKSFGDEGDLSRQLILTPTILNLLGNVEGKKVFDAGSGTGYLSRKLAKLKANVTASEPVKAMYDFCIKREQEEKLGIKFLNQDLSILDLKDTFDFVVSNMVLQDIPDYTNAIKNCMKVLKDNGKFIFSIQHPAFEGGSKKYIEDGFTKVEEYLKNYTTKQRFGYAFHRTISEYFTTIKEFGGNIIEMIEPGITEDQAEMFPEMLKDAHVPSFLFFVVERK